MPSPNLTTSGGLLTNQFVEAIQQPAFNHPALAPETFALPGGQTPSRAELDRNIATAWELAVERWDALERDLPGMDISTLRSRWILPLLALLDLELEYQRADLVLDSDLRFPISHLAHPSGKADSEAFIPVHTVLPAGSAQSNSLDMRPNSGSKTKRLAPHDLLQRYLNLAQDVLWGLVTNGLRLRLLRDYHHTYTRGYIEFDLQGIFTTRDSAAFRALYRLCHASRFLPMASTPAPAAKRRKSAKEDEQAEEAEPAESALTPLESFYRYALSTGVKVGEDLRKRVRAAIETLANGFLQASPGLLDALKEDEGVAANRLYAESLHIIYRLLFLLFAEQRGMLPGRGSLYMEEFSLTSLRAHAERPIGEDPHLDLWERLKTTFQMVEKGIPELGVFGYNGALFSPARTPALTPRPLAGEGSGVRAEMAAISNADLLHAVRALTTIERLGVLQRISYADLSVEEMGSVYESLLDFTPSLAKREEEIDGRSVRPGEFFLDPRGKERKKTGSYYTHPSLVNELIRSALLPVLEDRLGSAVPGYDAEHPERLTPEERTSAAQALLDLKVVDPACGSGAFLIAADNLLGQRLAQLNTGDLYPSEPAVRAARREALAHCIYGVDLNPMAVELCKVSLWINAAVPDQKLNFLNHHIKPGNSLVGIGPNLPAKLENEVSLDLSQLEIPDGAYDPTSMDDKAISRAARDRNRREIAQRRNNARQQALWQVTAVHGAVQTHYAEITDLSLSDPNEAERRFNTWAEAELFRLSRFAADVWTAAFFWHYDKETADRLEPPTEARFRLACEEGEPAFEPEFVKEVERQRDQLCFFHWPLEFPEVFGPEGRIGFDVILGNPPWERVKLQEKEFFGHRDSDIASAPNAAARKRMIEALPSTNPPLWQLFKDALRSAEATSYFLRNSGRYPLTGTGDINTYQVFSELDRGLTTIYGRAGFIVPSGLVTDYTNRNFFADLVEKGQLASLYDFENRRGIFPGVHRSYKFCLLTLRGSADVKSTPAEYAFFLYTIDDLFDPEKHFALSATDFLLLNPNTRTCPTFRTRLEAELTRKLYNAAPVLINTITEENSWDLRLATMFHSSGAAHLFLSLQDLGESYQMDTGNFIRIGITDYLPLFEGKMFEQYNHRAAGVVVDPQNLIRPATPLTSEVEDLKNPLFTPLPRFWVRSNEVVQSIGNWDRRFLLAFKKVTSPTNERTMLATILPFVAAVDSIHLIYFDKKVSSEQICFFLGNINSFTFDFIVRQKIGGVNLNFFVMEQLPVLPMSFATFEVTRYLTSKILELIYTSWNIKSFADEIWREAKESIPAYLLNQWDDNVSATGSGHAGNKRQDWAGPNDFEGFPRPPFKWDEEGRTHLRAELDGLYAHLYGLHRDELDFILETFPIVRRKDEEKYGEYRTKRLVLEAYDALAAREDYKELIPAEARQRSQESVIGKPAAPISTPLKPSEGKTGTRELKQTPAPAPATGIEAPQSTPPQAQKAMPEKALQAGTIKQTGPIEKTPPPSDYNLYRCRGCGKRVVGFDIEDHTRRVHGGKEPGFERIR